MKKEIYSTFKGVTYNYEPDGSDKTMKIFSICSFVGCAFFFLMGLSMMLFDDTFIMGACFCLLAVYMLYRFNRELAPYKKDKRAERRAFKKVRTTGQHYVAVVDSVEENKVIKLNSSIRYEVLCHYEDPFSGIRHEFKSFPTWGNVEQTFPAGSEVDVYVNPTDWSEYYVDVKSKLVAEQTKE